MSTPTPGPWIAKRDTGLRQRVQSASGGTLAYLTARPFAHSANVSYEQIAANARLIASAPELLEALCDCTDRMDSKMSTVKEFVESIRKARAVIAKAKGEA